MLLAWEHRRVSLQARDTWPLALLIWLTSTAQGVIHTQVTASVTKPEAVCSTVTNTFHFVRPSQMFTPSPPDYSIQEHGIVPLP